MRSHCDGRPATRPGSRPDFCRALKTTFEGGNDKDAGMFLCLLDSSDRPASFGRGVKDPTQDDGKVDVAYLPEGVSCTVTIGVNTKPA